MWGFIREQFWAGRLPKADKTSKTGNHLPEPKPVFETLHSEPKPILQIPDSEPQTTSKPVNKTSYLAPNVFGFEEQIDVISEYLKILDLLAAKTPIIFVTGGAGTGKSTLIRFLKLHFEKRKKSYAVLAPTGVAALNVGGQTIHSFFHFPHGLITDSAIKMARNTTIYEQLNLLVIDEISMVRCDVMDGIDRFLRLNRGNETPFGGLQLLLIGDPFQLPPVVEKDDAKFIRLMGDENIYFFNSSCLCDHPMVTIKLTKSYRHREDLQFLNLLNQMRKGENINNVLNVINKECCQHKNIDHFITLTCTRKVASDINLRELNLLSTQKFVFHGTVEGQLPWGINDFPSPQVLELKKGALVMFTKNDTMLRQNRWVNGTIGIVSEIDTDLIKVRTIEDNAKELYISPVTWDFNVYKYDKSTNTIVSETVAKYTQYPLMLAWAVTIHKSQGKTISAIEVNLGRGAFAPGQVYVALSRCRTIEGIRLAKPIFASDVIIDRSTQIFYESLSAM